jgi:hypothetical protein
VPLGRGEFAIDRQRMLGVLLFLATHVSAVVVTPGSRAFRDGLGWTGRALIPARSLCQPHSHETGMLWWARAV